MWRCKSVLALAGLTLALAAEVQAEAAANIGDIVIAVREGSLQVGANSLHAVPRGTLLAVEAVEGSWLWVSYGKSGWIDRESVLPRKEALAYFTRVISVNPSDAVAHRAIGKALMSLGDTEKALERFNTALRLGETPLAHADRGLVWSLTGEYEKATADFTRALELSEFQPLSTYELGGVYSMRGLALLGEKKVAGAIKDLDEAIRLCPEFAVAFNLRGQAYLVEGNRAMRAIGDFNRAIKLNSLLDAAQNNRGMAYLAVGDFQRAADDFRAAIGQSPDSAFARRTRSAMLHDAVLRSGKPMDAKTTGLLAPSDSPRNNLALLLATCPEARFRDGEKAVKHAEKLCELDRHRYYRFLDTLAAAHAESGAFENAVQWQTKAVELAPEKDKPELQSRLSLYKDGKPYRRAAKKE